MITINHFALPTWVDNARDPGCVNGPSDANLCGLDHPQGGAMVVRRWPTSRGCSRGTRRPGRRLGDDQEPMVYMLFAHGFGVGPAGKASLNPEKSDTRFVPAVRNLLNAHVAMYRAIKSVRPHASVGLANSVKAYVPVRDGEASDDPADKAAVDRFRWFFERAIVDSLVTGSFSHASTARGPSRTRSGRAAWTGSAPALRPDRRHRAERRRRHPGRPDDRRLHVCRPAVHAAAGPDLLEPAHAVRAGPRALYGVVKRYSRDYPGLPLVVSESSIATESADRRSAFIVRGLRQVAKLRSEGVDVRGYYYWSLLDDFEWLLGYGPHFGLYSVDRSTMARTATDTVRVYGDVAARRGLSPRVLRQYGAPGPLPPEPAAP